MNNSDKTSGHGGQPQRENHTMPDEIWANWMPADVGCGEWDKVSLGDDVPYTRTDKYEQVKAERDELFAALVGEVRYLNGLAALIEYRNGKDSHIAEHISQPLRIKSLKLQKKIDKVKKGE